MISLQLCTESSTVAELREMEYIEKIICMVCLSTSVADWGLSWRPEHLFIN